MNTYQLKVGTTCPVNGANITIEVSIVSEETIMVEDILKAVAEVDQEITQEDLTEALSVSLGTLVTTVGYHHGVTITSTFG